MDFSNTFDESLLIIVVFQVSQTFWIYKHFLINAIVEGKDVSSILQGSSGWSKN